MRRWPGLDTVRRGPARRWRSCSGRSASWSGMGMLMLGLGRGQPVGALARHAVRMARWLHRFALAMAPIGLRRRASPAGSPPKSAASPGRSTACLRTADSGLARCRAGGRHIAAGVRPRLLRRVRGGHLLHPAPDERAAASATSPGPRPPRADSRAGIVARSRAGPAGGRREHDVSARSYHRSGPSSSPSRCSPMS